MNVDRIISNSGDVSLTADMSILGRPDDILADVTGNSITLYAKGGSIGAPGAGSRSSYFRSSFFLLLLMWFVFFAHLVSKVARAGRKC